MQLYWSKFEEIVLVVGLGEGNTPTEEHSEVVITDKILIEGFFRNERRLPLLPVLETYPGTGERVASLRRLLPVAVIDFECQPFEGPDEQLPSRASAIIEATADYFGYTPQELVSDSRRRPLTYARQVGMFLVREHTALSYPSMAVSFNKDHSTVMHGVQKIKTRLESIEEDDLRQAIAIITAIFSDPENLGAIFSADRNRRSTQTDMILLSGQGLSRHSVIKDVIRARLLRSESSLMSVWPGKIYPEIMDKFGHTAYDLLVKLDETVTSPNH